MTTDDDVPPASSMAASPSLVDLVHEKIARENWSPANAAMAIGVAYPTLIEVLNGKPPKDKHAGKFSAWIAGTEPPADAPAIDEEPVTGTSVEAAASREAPAPAAAKRGRGRPAGVKAATSGTETSAPKRRGRPPKAEPTPEAAPKRRGRPPKDATASVAASAPKRRGRPPKDRSAVEAAPKRRGRPPKLTAPAGPAKRRGRPPKISAAPAATGKPRGRPPKSATGPARELGAALREIVALADDALAVAVHRAGGELRRQIERLVADHGN